MFFKVQVFAVLKHVVKHPFAASAGTKFYHQLPFLKLYKKTTGDSITQEYLNVLKKKHPNIDILTEEQLQCTLQILEKFNITAYEACKDPHVFCMNPISMDNYGEILRECGFVKIIPKHIIRYHTLVRSRTVEQLKKEGLIKDSIILEDRLEKCFQNWPDSHKLTRTFNESTTSILTIRLSILERYLNWKLNITVEEFQKYCKNYLPLKHRPMSDIQEAITLAQEEIGFDLAIIKRNGFIISSDPVNTKLIIENVPSIAGLDIREVIKTEPAILKMNYNGIIEIRDILEDYRISEEAQRRCLRVYCMCPKTIRERLDELKNLKEYQVLKSNPRVLALVVHKRKMMQRISRMQTANKHCFSLNHLIASTKVFNNYITSFGSKVCGRDIAVLICDSLNMNKANSQTESISFVLGNLKRHKFWLHTALSVIDDNIRLLQKCFTNDVIFRNCQILLYPAAEIQQYLDFFLSMRNTKVNQEETIPLDNSYSNLNYTRLTDEQILSLVLYEIEKKYHFSGDGIWAKNDNRAESQVVS